MACLDGLEGIPLPVWYLARCIKLPKPYLSKIIQILATKDFLETKRVNKGGDPSCPASGVGTGESLEVRFKKRSIPHSVGRPKLELGAIFGRDTR